MVKWAALWGALALILLIGGASILATISSIGASDSCGGCDATPAWASTGKTLFLVLGGAWAVVAITMAILRD